MPKVTVKYSTMLLYLPDIVKAAVDTIFPLIPEKAHLIR